MRFYADYGSAKLKRKGGRAPNALVIWPENGRTSAGDYEGRAAVFEHSDSALATTSISPDYLRLCCKRISKAEALSYSAMENEKVAL